MDMEARSFSPELSRQLLAKVKDYKADLSKLKEDAKKAAAAGADTRCAGALCVAVHGSGGEMAAAGWRAGVETRGQRTYLLRHPP